MSTDNDVTEKKSRLSPAKLALLEKQLRGAISHDPGPGQIPRRQLDHDLPLSFAQQRLWFLNQMEPDSAAYNISVAFKCDSPLSLAALNQAFNSIIARHEILRTSFAVISNQPVQVISPAGRFELSSEDLSKLSGRAQDTELRRIATNLAHSPFDLSQCPLFRSCLVRLGDTEHVVLFTIHHIIVDAWSIEILSRELAVFYDAFCRAQDSPLAELPIQYADYALWQRQWMQDGALEEQLGYWRERLRDAPTMLDLPTDKQRPQKLSFLGSQQHLRLSKELGRDLRALAQRENATLFMVLLAAFNVLLYRYSSQDDILVGCPVAGRKQLETESLIGFFVNTLVMRGDLSGDPSFRELLGRIRNISLAAFANQDVPFEKLVQELQPPRSVGHSPFFQVMFDFHSLSSKSIGEQDWRLHDIDVDRGAARADLLLLIEERDDSLDVLLEYSTELFEPDTISRMLRHFEVLLKGAVRELDLRISLLPLLTEPERRQLLFEWNRPLQSHAGPDVCLHQLFEKQVELNPNAVALVFASERLTYRELNNRANQLADNLTRLGVGPEVLVGLCVERSVEMIVSVLGILKAGGAYLPLDPAYPAERLAFMIEDSRTRVLLTQDHLREKLPADLAEVFFVANDGQLIDRDGSSPTAKESSREQAIYRQSESAFSGKNLAYVIYTSGSSGKPKGVPVSHYNVVRLFETTEDSFGFGKDDVWTLFHSFAFDFSVWEIWGALLFGGRLVIVPYLVCRSPPEFYELLEAENVTVLNQTPSAFRQLSKIILGKNQGKELALRVVIFGGEALDLNSLKDWFDRHGDQSPQLVNMYGITETTVHVTYRLLKRTDLAWPAGSMIGSALGDLQVLILDQHQQLVPAGVAGEIYVGGAGLSRGYLNLPELTAERFVPHFFSDEPGARLYKSGDLARFLSRGDIEYLGRADRQVKIRGFRVELGEIEAALSQYGGVHDCVVVSREDESRETHIVAYVVPNSGPPLKTHELRSYLRKIIPHYMVPAFFVLLEKIPLTTNEKIDLRALPAPEKSRQDLSESFIEPRTDNERKLAMMWCDVLGRKEIGIYDNFFDLGGHSLLATLVLSRIDEAFQIDLPLRYFFEQPTVAGLAEFVGNAKREDRRSRPAIRRLPRS